MFATRARFSLVTLTLFARAVAALAPSIAVTHPDCSAVVAPGHGDLPRVRVRVGSLWFVIAHARSRSGALHFFADGRMVLLPSCSRLQAQEIVRMFASIVDAYALAA